MNKKAALELGISTIVVMVIAMVVIGAAVSFIRTFFSSGTDSLMGSFDNVQDIGLNPDRNTPFMLDQRNIQISPTGRQTINAAFYNIDQATKSITINNGTCSPTLTGTFKAESVSVSVPSGESRGYQVLITTSGAGPGTYICPIQATNGTNVIRTVQATITITT